MNVTYTLKFTPSRYRIIERVAPSNAFPYWDIVNITNNDLVVGFAFTENDAKAIVFALDYTTAVLVGDKRAQKELMNALAKISN